MGVRRLIRDGRSRRARTTVASGTRANAIEPRLGKIDVPSRRDHRALRRTTESETTHNERDNVNISIFGLGYVGAVSLACLARDGHRVIGVDIDPIKLALIRNRKSPILEEGIQELMRDVVDSGRVSVTNDVMQAMRDTELSFVCVG